MNCRQRGETRELAGSEVVGVALARWHLAKMGSDGSSDARQLRSWVEALPSAKVNGHIEYPVMAVVRFNDPIPWADMVL